MSHADLPHIKPRELIRGLEKMGFQLLRKSKGSHWQFELRTAAARQFRSTREETSVLV